MSRRNAERESYQLVADTDSVVNSSIEKAVLSIKEQTWCLREALICAIEERNKVEGDLDDAKVKIAELEDEIEALLKIIADKD